MNDNLANFHRWFKEPLLRLQQDPDAGFIVVVISLVLLERYLRETSGTHESPTLNAAFYTEFLKLFPSVNGEPLSRKFWEVCRHGLMHQCALKIQTTKGENVTAGLHEDASEVTHQIEGSEDRFMVSPRKFSSRVIQIIENDFATFEGSSSPKHPLSQTSSIAGYSGYSGHKL